MICWRNYPLYPATNVLLHIFTSTYCIWFHYLSCMFSMCLSIFSTVFGCEEDRLSLRSWSALSHLAWIYHSSSAKILEFAFVIKRKRERNQINSQILTHCSIAWTVYWKALKEVCWSHHKDVCKLTFYLAQISVTKFSTQMWGRNSLTSLELILILPLTLFPLPTSFQNNF